MQENTSAALPASGTPQRQRFESLARTLEEQRARLRGWQAVLPEYQKKYEDVLAPLETVEVELKAKLVACFDHACKQKELTKAERALASEIAAQLAQETLDAIVLDGTPAECDTDRLKALYLKHAGSDYDASAEDVQDEDEVEVEAPPAQAAAGRAAPAPETLAEIDALAAAGPDGLAGVDEERYAQYNQALDAQLAVLAGDIAAAEDGFKAKYHFDPAQSIDPADLMEDLDAEIADAEEYIGELEFELSQFVDMQQVKAWLKAMKQQLAATRRREGRG
ncbi:MULTISPECIES: hypothetical protein [Achromobacter]|uniref:hypothetical protein n=1 Tax=Achromobacter TaxID=222 RepID=UPI002449BEDC|nr:MULTISPECIES: hypothetical protein [Achromobacter]MDH1302530.1 hypothetical protein [Achromobacter sp. GD03932]WLW59136.1 hypothetical protein RA224_18015 [Achromobacter aegrifaciens]